MIGGKAHVSVLLMVGFALAGCIGGGTPADTHDDCMDHAGEAMDSEDQSMVEQSNGTGSDASNDTGASPADTRFMSRQAGNGTGNDTGLPDDNEHGNIAESGHHDDCAADEEEVPDDSAGNETVDEAESVQAVSLSADSRSGNTPLTVTFTGFVESYVESDEDLDGDGEPDRHPVEPGNYVWTFIPGDGGANTEGDQSAEAITIEHTYDVEGAFEAYLQVTFESGEEQEASIVITTIASDPRGPPNLVFEFGSSLGCVSDGGNNCIGNTVAAAGGPVESGIDGHFIALDDRYWGMKFTTDSDNGDTDCILYDAAWGSTGEGNNGGGPCEGTVPANTVYIYVNPWAIPATYLTVSFTP